MTLCPTIHDRTSSWFHTPLVDILGCNLPILGAGMGGVARAELVAAISNAGGLGCLGMVREKPCLIQQQVLQVRKVCSAPFAVNIIPAATHSSLLNEQIDCLITLNVPIVCLFWDVKPEVVERFKNAGMIVLHQIGSLQDAMLALAAGTDVLIAQGFEAGGHVRGTKPTHELLPEICAFSHVPVVAAGGIGSGYAMFSAMSMGADGVWCGSAFLATHEANAHDYHKQRIVSAGKNDTVYTHCFHINWPEKAPVRVLKNSILKFTHQEGFNDQIVEVIGYQDGKSVFLYSTDSPLKDARGDVEKMALYAGESCSQINHICSAAERIHQFMFEAESCLHDNHVCSGSSLSSETCDVSSSPCLLGENFSDYQGAMSKRELEEILKILLHAERAGAKICAASLKQATAGPWRGLLRAIHRNEVKSCQELTRSLRITGGSPDTKVGDFYKKCMAIDDLHDRLVLLNKGQKWVIKQIDRALPRIFIPQVVRQLVEMKNEHRDGVLLIEEFLSSLA